MYGLLLENLAAFIKIQWGEGKWESVRRHAGVDAPSFSVHHVYAETLIPRLARSAVAVLGVGEKEFFEAMGVYFVEFMGQYGYDQVLSVLGRHMRDFLNGLDNLHEYLKFSYPRMRAPSFYCDNESIDGLTLHYRSKRRGFVQYAMGQIKQVAKHFYDMPVEIQLLSEELDGEMMHVKFHLKFDNRAFLQAQSLVKLMKEEEQLPVKASMLFELFPFCVVFCKDMMIRHTGHSLVNILPDLVGQTVSEAFDLVRPVIPFTFMNLLERRNNIFELVTVAPILDTEPIYGDTDDEGGVTLRLKGQMLHMEDWNMMIYLATPQMPDLDSLLASGLYINDLSLHDCSRDLVLAGTQQSVELKLALDQEQQKSSRLEASMKQLDMEMKRTDELLYNMIPKQVADRIRRGENPVDTCEVFDTVSILFSDVVTFTEICGRINPMQVVQMLNHMYSLFDQLTERNGVYKVETIGDAYMVVGGAPIRDPNHAEKICDMAMDMVDASREIKDPSGATDHLQLRVGVHSGDVVAGVVGLKMPRYCLFGDTVNTSSRMESSSAPSKIQISETTKALLPKTYMVEFRGETTVKGKGQMSTFWLNGRKERIPLSELQCNSFSWSVPTMSTGGGANIADSFRSPAPSLDDVRGKSFSESSQSAHGPSLGRLAKEPTTSAERRRRPNSRPGLPSQDSVSRMSSTHGDGHIPLLKHQPSLSHMNMSAARAAVTESLRAKPASESYPGADSGAPPPFRPNSGGLQRLLHSGSISDLRKNRDPGPPKPLESPTPKPPEPTEPEKPNEPEKPKEPEPESSKEVEMSLQQKETPAPMAEMEKSVGQESASKPIEAAGTLSSTGPVTEEKGDNPSKRSDAEPIGSLAPAQAAQNQKQDIPPAKATLGNSLGNSFSPPAEPSSSDRGPKPRDSGERVPRKERLVKRLKENKVALLTSEAMAQMGCNGFVTKQKEVIRKQRRKKK